MISKTNVVMVSGVVSIGLIVWNFIGNYRICDFFYSGSSANNCPFVLTAIGLNLLPIIPFFVFALVTYKMRDDVYRAWLRFSYIWIPLSMLLIFLSPEYSTDWMYPIAKASVAFISSLIYCLISVLLIAWKYFAPRRA